MDSIYWLMGANVAVWLGLGGYVFFLAKAQASLNKRLELKESIDNE